jgi:putative spermidine/putrescine transport system substrate-binding protein
MRFTKAALVTLCATGSLVLAACGGGSDDGSDASGDGGSSITFATYGSAFEEAQKKAFIDPFTTQTGIKVTTDSPTDLAKLKVMVESKKVTWDVYLADQQQPVGFCDTLFEKLDLSNIPSDQFPPGTISDCGVPVDTYSYLIAYNTEKYGTNPPTGIKDFFDPQKFPGTRALSNFPAEGTLEMALLADGVGADKLYPIDYTRAFATLDKIKKGLIFWESGAEQVEMMESKRADMILVWSGRGYEAVANGAPYKPVWADNSYHWASLAIPKGSPNKAAAQKFIDFSLSAGPQAAFAEAIAYGAANITAKPKIDAARADWDSSAKDHIDQSWSIDNQWWADHEDEVTERWTAWTAG